MYQKGLVQFHSMPTISELTRLLGHIVISRNICNRIFRLRQGPRPRPQNTDHGPWTMDRGPWSMDHGPWTTDHGPWTTDYGPRLHGLQTIRG